MQVTVTRHERTCGAALIDVVTSTRPIHPVEADAAAGHRRSGGSNEANGAGELEWAEQRSVLFGNMERLDPDPPLFADRTGPAGFASSGRTAWSPLRGRPIRRHLHGTPQSRSS